MTREDWCQREWETIHLPILAYPARIGQGDANGNLLSNEDYNYTYNSANQLVSVSDGVSTTTYGYNAQGDRVCKSGNEGPRCPVLI